ncbi:hypothetical protein ABZW30_29540 [Kitasatospora sp. NPDC004669]|uniref:hypothetical protein n=1 Tax=Kitasatospora sp. NPDC004669 TaxID=3154555 RepID=UPI0033AB9780
MGEVVGGFPGELPRGKPHHFHVFAVGTDGKVYGRDGRLGDSWTPWVEVPGGATNTKAVTATTG